MADDPEIRPSGTWMSLAADQLAAAGGIFMIMQSLGQRGGERVAVLLANGFAEAGIPVRVALLRDDLHAKSELGGLLRREVTVVSAGPPIRAPGRKHFERVRAVPFIRRQVRQLKPAVVLGTVNSVALVTAFARERAGAGPRFALKLTNRIVAPNKIAPLASYRHKAFAFIFDRLDLVLTLSNAERRNMLDLYPGHRHLFRTVPNPYVTQEMLAGPDDARSPTPRILAVGSMVRQKRLDVLLQAFALVKDKTSRLTILGDGPLRTELAQMAQALGIADRVHMPGFVEDVVPWFRKSDLFVLSSDYEGLPAVVFEALACGVPVVATNSFAAANELLGRLSGCAIAPIGDAEGLAQGINQSLEASYGPEELRCLASEYLIEQSVAAHIEQLSRCVVAR